MPLSQEESKKLKKTATAASVALAVSLSLLKMFGALYTGSLAVLSSMIDSLADIFASSVTFIAVKISSQPADSQSPLRSWQSRGHFGAYSVGVCRRFRHFCHV